MAATGSVALANEVKPFYDMNYLLAAQSLLYFDQQTDPRPFPGGSRGQSINFPIIESQAPATAILDELADVTPSAMRANEVVVTINEYGAAIQVTRYAAETSYADVYKQAADANGYNMAESVDNIVRAVAGQGSRVILPSGRAARTALQGVNTASDRISTAQILRAVTFARGSQMPLFNDGTVVATMHPFVQYDLLQDPQVVTMSQYQYPNLLLNGEIGMLGSARILVSSNAKVFWGGGTTQASGSVSTTLAANVASGAVALPYTGGFTSANAQSIANVIDAAETGNTWTDTNEGFFITSVGTSGAGGTGLTGFAINAGPGNAGSIRYAHTSGITLNNNCSVYPISILGPTSITKAYATQCGPFGETTITGPFDTLGRFLNFGWYGIFGWSRTRDGWLTRLEVGSSQA